MKPGLGRIVHYKTFDGFVFAAMIVHVDQEKNTVNLNYWTDRGAQHFVAEVEQIPGPLEDGQTGWFYPRLDPAQAAEFQKQMEQMRKDIEAIVRRPSRPARPQQPFNTPRLNRGPEPTR